MEEKEEGEQDKIQQVGRMGHWVWPSWTRLPTLWGLGWAGLEHSPAARHHQLHLHFVGNNDAQDLPVGPFPQPARRHREAGSWVL